MPHYACANCRIRHHTAGASAELVGELCPRCGSPLEPAAELEGLVGFQSIERLDDPADAVEMAPLKRLMARLDEFSARRTDVPERDVFDTEPWGDGDDPVATAVALPVVQRYR